eukprot:TRINITY_DN2922_c0_g1_i5.p1 TRINITY_DN2922_c0_g1~~TRINITY_DN2922_c0_g1_i5.p1  ORF type:complete len:293 (-),score=33.83 TRINITY_DN2922_c0_g1_i5:390-1268(-)
MTLEFEFALKSLEYNIVSRGHTRRFRQSSEFEFAMIPTAKADDLPWRVSTPNGPPLLLRCYTYKKGGAATHALKFKRPNIREHGYAYINTNTLTNARPFDSTWVELQGVVGCYGDVHSWICEFKEQGARDCCVFGGLGMFFKDGALLRSDVSPSKIWNKGRQRWEMEMQAQPENAGGGGNGLGNASSSAMHVFRPVQEPSRGSSSSSSSSSSAHPAAFGNANGNASSASNMMAGTSKRRRSENSFSQSRPGASSLSGLEQFLKSTDTEHLAWEWLDEVGLKGAFEQFQRGEK